MGPSNDPAQTKAVHFKDVDPKLKHSHNVFILIELHDFPSKIILWIEAECDLVYRHWLFAFLSSGVRRSSRSIFREVQSNYRKLSEKHRQTDFTSTETITDWQGVFSSIMEPKTSLFHLQMIQRYIPRRRKLSFRRWQIWHEPSFWGGAWAGAS